MMSDISTIGADSGETVCRMPMGLDIVVTGRAPARLPGEGRPQQTAHRLTARVNGEYLFVGVRGSASGAFDAQRSREIRLEPGDICFYAADRPPLLDFPEHVRLKLFLVPREALGLEERDVEQVMAAPVGRSSRLGALLSPFLSELADTVSSSQPAVGEMLAWNAVNLLATLATEQLGKDATGIPDAQSPLLSRILRFIDLHLADGDLSPELIAGAHHISVRYLHKLFQDEGTTVGRWIQRRRLEECRRDLMRGVHGRQTIAAVAGRWGFLSATHFSRVFRAAYGMSPSEWRDTAGRGTRFRRR
ncbi:helix-turn-helix domain-containing protein [Streptomyces albicerus]|uniref:helix-turn-helix domain-containing protein n=1 Tax=Streptomyces albicerus TaxID=2569859 RepID=UPI00124BC55D|nr:helix-turn-helix domain-containing protein [Streptomyces albicerus]